MILDLESLDYISSAGLRVLLTGAKRLKAKRGKIVLCSAQRHVKEVFDISGFSMIIKVFNDEEEALSGF